MTVYKPFKVGHDIHLLSEDFLAQHKFGDGVPLRVNSDGYFEEEKAEPAKEPFWCEHFRRNEHGLVLDEGGAFFIEAHDTWKFCPICGAKRPERV